MSASHANALDSHDVESDTQKKPKDDNSLPNHAHLFVFSGANKAGMSSIDKEKQANTIYEMSKDSEYFKRAKEQDEKTKVKTNQMIDMMQRMTPTEKKSSMESVQKKLAHYESMRDLTSMCCVLDMDMFYAAVEIRDRPELSDKPVAVGGSSMICTTNYVARKYGVRSAMPGFIGKKLCPGLIFIEPNFEKYEKVGHQIREIIAEYDPHYESFSLDEVYFNLSSYVLNKINGVGSTMITTSTTSAVTNASTATPNHNAHTYVNEYDDSNTTSREKENINHNHHISSSDSISLSHQRRVAAEVLQEIRRRICDVTGGLTSSAGLASNFMLAKICAGLLWRI